MKFFITVEKAISNNSSYEIIPAFFNENVGNHWIQKKMISSFALEWYANGGVLAYDVSIYSITFNFGIHYMRTFHAVAIIRIHSGWSNGKYSPSFLLLFGIGNKSARTSRICISDIPFNLLFQIQLQNSNEKRSLIDTSCERA